ncbi:MAG: RebB family R body protein [Polaribacter sp.]|uniref:RebB family R body protein n=1 Tax=Polaribacter sp. TaxID=1920175 RepID=UPI003267D9EE
MADTVNSQITDAVTQSNVKVVAEAPAMAMGNVYQSLAHSMGLLMENSVNQQQQASILSQAVTTQCVTTILATKDAGNKQ